MPVRGRNAGNKGQGSKWISKARRKALYERDRWRCRWCGTDVIDYVSRTYWLDPRPLATLDHVVPRSKGGTNATNNLITACMACNRERGDMSLRQYAAVKGQQIAAAIRKAVKG